jgi:hypothetical protein
MIFSLCLGLIRTKLLFNTQISQAIKEHLAFYKVLIIEDVDYDVSIQTHSEKTGTFTWAGPSVYRD